MSNFNQYFRNQGAKILVEKYFSRIDAYSDAKLTNLTFKIVDEDVKPASYYIENELTATHKIRLEYTINNGEELQNSEFEIPMEVDGVFIIEGAYRIATNRLEPDFDCRIRMSGTGDHIINFDYDRRYDINKKVLRVKKYDPSLSVPMQLSEFKLEEIDNLQGDKKELLKLSETQAKKFMIKLDLDYKPEYISERLISDCLRFGDDRVKDLIIDKTIQSVYNGFMQWMLRGNNNKNLYGTVSRLSNHWNRNKQLPPAVNIITSQAIRYFKGAVDKSRKGGSDVQVSPGINPINLHSIGNKIVLAKSVAFNTTFADLIDIQDTPINQNTNLQNSLTVSTHVTEDGILFDVYSPEWQVITIPYIDYLNKKVCASEYVDYETNTIKPNKDGMVECKYRMKRKMIPASEIELIDLHPDYRLSEVTRRIPFVNFTDSVRISMGTSMLKQSIPLVNAERSLVDTGRSEELNKNVLNERFKHPEGKVTEITEDKVVIKLPDNTDIEVPRRTAIQSVNDVSVYTEPKVKVGQILKEGDVITGGVGVTKDTYKAGLNTLVLFHAYHGLVNEDALVVSESYANRMASYSIIDLSINVKTSTALKWIAPIGTKVKSKDNIVTLYKAIRLDAINETLTKELGNVFGSDLADYTVEDHLKVPNNIDEAVVSDVLIQEMKNPIIQRGRKKPDYAFARTSQKVIEEYEKEKDRKVIYERYPEYIASDTLDPVVMDPTEFKIVYTIRIRLIKKQTVVVGSKITSRYGGKGVVSAVKPDETMPIMVDKKTGKQTRVEVIMNPYSTVNRKIAGVLYELNLGNIAHKIYDLVEEYKKTKTGQKKIKPLLEKYYPGRYDSMSVEEFIKLHNSSKMEDVYYFNVGCYSSFTPEKIDKWMEELDLESQSEILMPENELTDLDELKENLSEEEYKKIVDKMKGKFIPVKKNLQCGYMTLEQLYHIPSYSNKVTSSLFGTDVNPKKDDPIMGRGKYRLTGQKIGEMELAVLLSRNAKPFIQGARRETAREDNQIFLNNLLGLGLTVTGEKGYYQGGSSQKDTLEKMKAKFRLKSIK